MQLWEDFNARCACRRTLVRWPLAPGLALIFMLLSAWPALAQTPGAYIKTGPVLTISDGFFEKDNVGWSIAGGLRQPIAPPIGAGFIFVDVGGSFMQVTGDDDSRDTPGTFVIISSDPFVPNVSIPVESLIEAELRDIRRASVDVAVGFQNNPPRMNFETGSLFSWMVRGGGRFGHVHGIFRERLTPEGQALVDMLAPGDTYVATPAYSKNDTFGGLFLGFGTGVSFLNFETLVFGPLDLSLGVESEFSYDWIDFKNYQDSGVGTAAILFSATITR